MTLTHSLLPLGRAWPLHLLGSQHSLLPPPHALQGWLQLSLAPELYAEHLYQDVPYSNNLKMLNTCSQSLDIPNTTSTTTTVSMCIKRIFCASPQAPT